MKRIRGGKNNKYSDDIHSWTMLPVNHPNALLILQWEGGRSTLQSPKEHSLL